MASFNRVMVMGNVTRDVELRYTPGGTAVADIGLAVNRVRTGDNGEKVEEVTFVEITLWGRTAEVVSEYSGKGKPLFVEGRLQMDTWTDRETGKPRSRLKIVGESIQLLGSKAAAETGAGGESSVQVKPSGGGGGKPPSDPVRRSPGSGQVDDDGLIPF